MFTIFEPCKTFVIGCKFTVWKSSCLSLVKILLNSEDIKNNKMLKLCTKSNILYVKKMTYYNNELHVGWFAKYVCILQLLPFHFLTWKLSNICKCIHLKVSYINLIKLFPSSQFFFKFFKYDLIWTWKIQHN